MWEESPPLAAQLPLRSEELCWLRSRDGRFLSAGAGGTVGTIAHVRSWEWFTLIVVRDRIVVVMTHQGTFLCVVDEDVRHHHIASEQADSFQFEVAVVGGGVTLRNVQTRGLLSALPGDLGVVKCVSSGFADGERVIWADAKGYLPAVAGGEVSISLTGLRPPPSGVTAGAPKTTRPPEIRRNSSTGDVVVIAPERLARLKVNPFQASPKTELLDMWPEFDEDGGLAWQAKHPSTFEALVRIARRATAKGRTVSITALQDALVLAGPAAGAHFPTPPPTPGAPPTPPKAVHMAGGPPVDEEPLPPGLPIPPRSTAPYVARLVAQALPVERASLVLDKAGMCPFCSKCRDDVPAPGEIVNTDVVLLRDAGRGLGFRRGSMVPPPAFAANGLASLNNLDLQCGMASEGHGSLTAVLASVDATATSSFASALYRRSCTWLARNIEQRFPTLRPGVQTHTTFAGGLFQAWEGAGTHELFLESPRHNASFGSCMSLAEVYAVLLLWTRRYRQLCDSGDVPFAMIFKNNGFEAGATQQHPHSQLIGFPVVPARTTEMLNCARTHHEVNGSCCYCAMARALRKPSVDKERPCGQELVVYQNELFVAFCPWAPPCDYAIYIMPWAHSADLLLGVSEGKAPGTTPGTHGQPDEDAHAGQRTLAALADCLRMAARKLYVYCGNPDYNLVVRNPPFSARHAEWYHWHIELAPTFTKKGGLEYGTHCQVLMMAPDVAARNLRETKVGEEEAAAEEEEASEPSSAPATAPSSEPPADSTARSSSSSSSSSSMAIPVLASASALGSVIARLGSFSALDSFND